MTAVANLLTFVALGVTLVLVWRQSWRGRVLRAAARRAAVVQSGSPNLYLAYVLVALLLLLLVA